jgi:hypothetical protein
VVKGGWWQAGRLGGGGGDGWAGWRIASTAIGEGWAAVGRRAWWQRWAGGCNIPGVTIEATVDKSVWSPSNSNNRSRAFILVTPI